MSWFFNVAPYVLAFGAIALGAFEITKDWKEYESKWLRMAVALVFVIVAVVSVVSLYHDNQDKMKAEQRAETNATTLQAKVDAANQAQTANTKLFVDSLKKMSGEVSDLKTEVKTEALQKKLASVQADLQKTQTALAPGPKSELAFTFVPYVNPPFGQPLKPVIETTLPQDQDGSIHVEFTVWNPTDVDAIEVDVNVHVCDECKFAREPAGLTRLAGLDERTRFLFLKRQHAREAYHTIAIDVIPPPLTDSFYVGFDYRCSNCVISEALKGLVNIARPWP
jgi:hypothetical protein